MDIVKRVTWELLRYGKDRVVDIDDLRVAGGGVVMPSGESLGTSGSGLLVRLLDTTTSGGARAALGRRLGR